MLKKPNVMIFLYNRSNHSRVGKSMQMVQTQPCVAIVPITWYEVTSGVLWCAERFIICEEALNGTQFLHAFNLLSIMLLLRLDCTFSTSSFIQVYESIDIQELCCHLCGRQVYNTEPQDQSRGKLLLSWRQTITVEGFIIPSAPAD